MVAGQIQLTDGFFVRTLVLATSLLVSACGMEYRVVGEPARPVLPAPRIEVPVTPDAVPFPPTEPPTQKTDRVEQPEPPTTPTASQLLVAVAREQTGNGDYSRAAATLERALRMAPKDAALWHELALVRLAAGDWEQAIQLANKSRTLAGDNQELRRKNSEIIAIASEKL